MIRILSGNFYALKFAAGTRQRRPREASGINGRHPPSGSAYRSRKRAGKIQAKVKRQIAAHDDVNVYISPFPFQNRGHRLSGTPAFVCIPRLNHSVIMG